MILLPLASHFILASGVGLSKPAAQEERKSVCAPSYYVLKKRGKCVRSNVRPPSVSTYF
jgi:hypothetical protein